jgi:hypothetical protein
MQGSEILVGHRYGMRMKVGVGEPLVEVKVTEKVGRKGHIKVQHQGGETPGLEEYVKTRQIIVAWEERKGFLRDEERLRRAEQASAKEVDRARADATETVLFSTGDPAAGLMSHGMLCMDLESVQRVAERAGLTEPVTGLHPAAFVDRFGTLHLPYEGAEKLARAFAAAEPETVLLYIQDQEAEYKARGYEPGERFWHDYLREKAAGHALARHWARHERVSLVRSQTRGYPARPTVGGTSHRGPLAAARRLQQALVTHLLARGALSTPESPCFQSLIP